MLLIDPGLICGLVLPILGALPDAATVLFSGLGPTDTIEDRINIQNQINVGMGSLAGSSISELNCAKVVQIGVSVIATPLLLRSAPDASLGGSGIRGPHRSRC